MAEKRGSSHHHRRSSTTSGSGWHKQPNQGESSGKQTEKHAESHSKKQSSEKHHSKRVQSSETYPQDGPGDRSVIEQGEKQRPANKFNINDAVELKSTHAHYIVNNYTYNETRNGWDYTLREAGFGGANCAEPVEETKLKRRKGDGTNG